MRRMLRLLCAVAIAAALISGTVFAMQKKVKVAFCVKEPPYRFIDAEGNYAGLHIDIMNSIANMKNLLVEYVPMSTDGECLHALDTHEVDLVLGITTDSYPSYLSQSTGEISSSNLSVFVPNDIERQIKAGSSFGEYTAVARYKVGNSTVMMNLGVRQRISVGNLERVFASQRSGLADIMVGDRNSLQYQIYQAGMEDDFMIYSNYVGMVQYNILVTAGDQDMLRIINNGLAQLRTSGAYDELNSRWTIDEESLSWKAIVRNIIVTTVVAASAALLYIITQSRVRKLLKQQVEEKTRELQASNTELGKRILQLEDESELRNRLIQHSPNGMVLFGRDYSIVLMNKNALDLAGISEIPAGSNAENLPVFGQILQKLGGDMFQTGVGLDNMLAVLLDSGGETRSYRCSLHPVMNLGQITGALLSVEDITQEEARKNALFEKEKNLALNRIVAGIAHEIRNPLMTIRTFATLSQTKKNDERFLDAFGDCVPTEVDRINKLVEGLINYARPVRGGVQPIPLMALVDECLYLTKTVVAAGRIQVVAEGPRDLCAVANPDQLKQVLINIIMNGLESMEPKLECEAAIPLHFTITVEKVNRDTARITVRDEGQGMPREVLRQCMEPFFTTKASGTGLGLALCRQYMQENGGSLSISSVEGQSTTVVLTLRAADSAETEDAGESNNYAEGTEVQ